ncbi:MAG: cofactor-independent phosphoglycerate mutase [Bacteroidales bacterium]|nr:cofactor-independent phosphoglycerate mutase [Clostridium sp.]MCM1204204.1 cofactor-independent phosphoglycerate mutase [Bacteroidales bacterium]
MKYVIVLGDGMADYPIEEIGNETVIEHADTPTLDELAGESEVGMVLTVPEGMSPGSDTANLSVIGYDPKKYYSGRSPLEALSIGVDMKPTDISFRCNLVTVSGEEEDYKDKTIIDHSSSEISTEDAAVLLKAVSDMLEKEYSGYKFYVGTSYRHLTIWDGGEVLPLTPPHDILGKTIGEYLPEDAVLREMMEKSYAVLENHPINTERRKKGLNPANSLWFWGAGTRPALSGFKEKNGKSGVMISAVDLLKGIAVGAGMKVVEVEGANGGLHTNYTGKAMAAVKALCDDGYDFAYIHVEAPDEMGHQGSLERKLQAVEYLDKQVIRVVKEQLEEKGEDFRLLVLPDHPTPICLRTHVGEPVPYLLYDSTDKKTSDLHYNEKDAKKSGIYIENGYKMIDHLFEK